MKPSEVKSCWTIKPGTDVDLKDFKPRDTAGYENGEAKAVARLAELREELSELQGLLYAENRHALLVIFQGMDASGKDGTVRAVMSGLNPQGVSVVPFKAPHSEELEHDYLWRVHKQCPRKGEIAIFNRSHYEDVLIVRVHELVPKDVWRKRFRHINEFERMLVDSGTLVLKFFLHISKEEQKRRFEDRLKEPKKYWKFSEKDIEERRFWKDYRSAYESVLTECTTSYAPWTIVPADEKWYRNVVVAERIVDQLRGLKMAYPEAQFIRKKIHID